MTKQAAWRMGTDLLQQAGVADARWQAELLLRGALREDRARFLASLSEQLPDGDTLEYRRLLTARAAGQPTQYLLGQQEFMGLSLQVTPAVLIPRPDTETLVEEAIRLLGHHPAPRVVDLATGSGAIALSLAKQLPHAQLVATDISEAALAVAQGNAARLGLAERVDWRLGPWLEPLRQESGWQAIVSNPPYIPSADIAGLSPEVQQEPLLALDGGHDGLDCYRALIPAASLLLAAGGWLLLEVGAGQAVAVLELMRAAGLEQRYTVADLAGVARVVVGRRLEQ